MSELIPGVSPAKKVFKAGTHRHIVPEQTLARVQPWMPAMGITRIANVTGLDTVGIPVVVVCRPNARSLSVSQGKGVTLCAAKASGLMESVEFWHAERINQPLLLGSVQDLQFSHSLADVANIPRLSVSTFSPDTRILWIEGFDLAAQSHKWLPYECVHTDYRLPLPPGSGCFAMNSNGLASGNHVLEAASHAICEVIERDANALWFAGGNQAREALRVDLNSVDDPECRELLDQLTAAGLLIAVWNTTTDIGVPAFACEIVDDVQHSHRGLGPSAGMGCHPSAAVALSRSLTEAAQSRLTRIASSRDDVPRIDYETTRNPQVLDLVRKEYVNTRTNVQFSDVAGFESDYFDEDVRWLISLLHDSGIGEVNLVDLTSDKLQIPVVRAVIPGLEAPHEAPGYTPGPRAKKVQAAYAAMAIDSTTAERNQ